MTRRRLEPVVLTEEERSELKSVASRETEVEHSPSVAYRRGKRNVSGQARC
jgi:hypothetical protein